MTWLKPSNPTKSPGQRRGLWGAWAALSPKLLGKEGHETREFFFFLNNSSCLFFFYSFYLFILFMAVLGPRLRARAPSSCGKWGPLFIAVRGPLTIAASLVAEHRLQTRRPSNCGSRAQSLRGTWDPPRPGPEPAPPALAGRPSTTAPPGKPREFIFNESLVLRKSGEE